MSGVRLRVDPAQLLGLLVRRDPHGSEATALVLLAVDAVAESDLAALGDVQAGLCELVRDGRVQRADLHATLRLVRLTARRIAFAATCSHSPSAASNRVESLLSRAWSPVGWLTDAVMMADAAVEWHWAAAAVAQDAQPLPRRSRCRLALALLVGQMREDGRLQFEQLIEQVARQRLIRPKGQAIAVLVTVPP